MEGKFLGWIPSKTFGFIVPDDAPPGDKSANALLLQSRVPFPQSLRHGTRLHFDVEENDRGRVAINVSVIADEVLIPSGAERKRGHVTYWNAKGFGYIEQENGGSTSFVHCTDLALEENGYLCEGDVVEYYVLRREGDERSKAAGVRVIGWERPCDGLSAFADMGPPKWASVLDGLDEELERWEYEHTPAPEPLPILRSYIRHTFRRLEETGAVAVSPNGKFASFNTGLVTPNQEEIYAMFSENARANRQPWVLLGFRKESDRDFVEHFGASPPPLASYFDDPTVLLYDRRCKLYINVDHVLQNIDRFPSHLRSNPYAARQLLQAAQGMTTKRVYRNYKAAIPQFFRDKGGDGAVQLLLPICLDDPKKADLALVIAKQGTEYRGSTVLTLDMAYNNARLLTRPDTEWLRP